MPEQVCLCFCALCSHANSLIARLSFFREGWYHSIGEKHFLLFCIIKSNNSLVPSSLLCRMYYILLLQRQSWNDGWLERLLHCIFSPWMYDRFHTSRKSEFVNGRDKSKMSFPRFFRVWYFLLECNIVISNQSNNIIVLSVLVFTYVDWFFPPLSVHRNTSVGPRALRTKRPKKNYLSIFFLIHSNGQFTIETETWGVLSYLQ